MQVDVRMPRKIGDTPDSIGKAPTFTQVLHQCRGNHIRDEYALENGNLVMHRSITWLDPSKTEAVQYLITYDLAAGKCRVTKLFATPANPTPKLEYERLAEPQSAVDAKFGSPGAAAQRLAAAACGDASAAGGDGAVAVAGGVGGDRVWGVPLMVRGADGQSMWRVVLPVQLVYAGDADEACKAWGFVGDVRAVATTVPRRTAFLLDTPPSALGVIPPPIADAAVSTSVFHRRDGMMVRDDYASVDPRTLLRSIVMRTNQALMQYLMQADFVDGIVHIVKWFAQPQTNQIARDYEEDQRLDEAHVAFGAPGTAAAELFQPGSTSSATAATKASCAVAVPAQTTQSGTPIAALSSSFPIVSTAIGCRGSRVAV